MIEIIIHYLTIALIVALTSIGSGIAGGICANAAIDAINTQPNTQPEITKTSIVALALLETAAILGLILGLILVFGAPPDFYPALAQLGILAACGFSGIAVSIASSYPAKQACYAIARQPFFSQKILNVMLVAVSIIQTPFIFAFITSLLIFGQLKNVTTLFGALQMIASGLAIGLGSIGPVIGLGLFAAKACWAVGVNRSAYTKIFPFTFISQAIIETPIIFSLVVSLLLVGSTTATTYFDVIRYLAAALCVGIGTFSPGINSGKTAQAAAEQIALNPLHYSAVSRSSMIAQALIEAASIYALLVALIILLF